MVLKKFWSGLVLGLVIAGTAGMAHAGEKSVKILMPWDGEGSVYTIGTDKLLFMGEFEGIMYVETSAGELDAAYANCPASQHIDMKGKQSSATGYCTITISSEEVVFAEWNCKGKVGVCEGTLNLTGAETAPNIAEITVLDDRVQVALAQPVSGSRRGAVRGDGMRRRRLVGHDASFGSRGLLTGPLTLEPTYTVVIRTRGVAVPRHPRSAAVRTRRWPSPGRRQ